MDFNIEPIEKPQERVREIFGLFTPHVTRIKPLPIVSADFRDGKSLEPNIPRLTNSRISSLTRVNWEEKEAAEQEVLRQLGCATIPLSQETRDFIMQAARNAKLPHRQEILLTTQMAKARAQLALLPTYDEEQEEDPYATERKTLQAEITEVEQILTCKMQWVAIKKAVHFLGHGIELDDLIQFGMLGVIAGIRHFDIKRNTRLLISVHIWTFQSLTRAIGDYGGIIRFPLYVLGQIGTLKKLHLQWQLSQGHLPTRKELAKAMGMSVHQLATLLGMTEILQASQRPLSLERCAQAEYSNEGYSFQDTESAFMASEIASTTVLEDAVLQQMLDGYLKDLSPREVQILLLRTGLDQDGVTHTLEEVGQLLGLSRERVRQIEGQAKAKVRGLLRDIYPELALKEIELEEIAYQRRRARRLLARMSS